MNQLPDSLLRLLTEDVGIHRLDLKTENCDGAHHVHVFTTFLPVEVDVISRWQVTEGICIAEISCFLVLNGVVKLVQPKGPLS